MATTKKNIKREKPIPKEKLEDVKELLELAKTKKTILIASTKNLPDSLFQKIRKKLRNKAVIKVPKRNIIIRALDNLKKDSFKQLKDQIKGETAILFSDLDGFELAAELLNNKVHSKAKTGQIAPLDIEIPEGPTELVPGPAISELGALGIQIIIDKGKISIKKAKVIVKQGEKISDSAASIMNKLDIKPFNAGFVPLAAFDTQEGKLYLNINIDRETIVNEIKSAYNKALPFAVNIGYTNSDTIIFLLSKAGMQEKAIKKLIKEDSNAHNEKIKQNAEKIK